MEKYFGNAYRGDPGVPHADADRLVNIWIGSAAFSVLTWFNPYMWQLSNQFKLKKKKLLSTLSTLRDKVKSLLTILKLHIFCNNYLVSVSLPFLLHSCSISNNLYRS
ncbi:hypothetical protein Bca4012_069070 [Brassica carinata]|uniref:Uncharacterized protein n=1 Tax=Brassica carinata TaxID=52824 RepID=A0A8X7VUF9_BRACI|nr:hypothetical protein Bca52824_021241 [Brassica carinata]